MSLLVNDKSHLASRSLDGMEELREVMSSLKSAEVLILPHGNWGIAMTWRWTMSILTSGLYS